MTTLDCSQGGDFRFADCVVRSSSREVLFRGMLQPVERRTFDVMEQLVVNRDRVVSKDDLLQHVWRNTFLSDAVITQCIMKARSALEQGTAGAGTE